MSRARNDEDAERIAREIDRELAFHLDMRTQANLARGMSRREARRDAERRLGALDEIRSAGLSILAGGPPPRGPRLDPGAILEDLRLAARRLAREPLMATLLVAVVALGIAANAAIFGVVNAVVLQPLDFPRPDRIVRLYTWEVEEDRDVGVSPPDLADWATSDALAHAALFSNVDMRVTGGAEPHILQGGTATEGFFDVLGIEPVAGRRFTVGERADRERVLILTERGRSILLGEQGDALGATVHLDGEPWTVVGLIPQPDFPFQTELFWVPWAPEGAAAGNRGFRVFNAVGRLAPGVTLERARADLQQIAGRLASAYPDANEGISVRVLPFHESMLGTERHGMFLLLGAVAVLLAITCANVAGLMLARAARWRHEIAVRGALGADRWQLVRHLGADGALVALAGGLVALPLASWGIDVIQLISPAGTPRLEQAGFDAGVGLYAFGLTTLVILWTAMTSAWSTSRPDLMRPLRVAASGHTGARRGAGRKALVATEAALATVLVIGAGLLARNLVNVTSIDPGYRYQNILTAWIAPFAEHYPGEVDRSTLFRGVLTGARGIAGVESAALVASIPQGPGFSLRGLRGPGPDPDQEITAEYQRVSRGYFDTLQIPLLRGRDFSEEAVAAGEREIIVSEGFSRAVWPDDPQGGLGRTVDRGADLWRVVGVAADIRYGLKRPPRPTFYVHYSHEPPGRIYAVLRTTGEPTSMLPAFRSMLRSRDPDLPVASAMPLEERLAGSLAADRFRLRVVGAFALVAVTLCCLGIYGLMAYTVTGRVREIGVRMATGATRRDIVTMVVGEGMLVVALGVAGGLLAAAGLSRLMASLLYEMSVFDPIAFTLFPAALVVTALAACLLPSRRAAGIEPVVALRIE